VHRLIEDDVAERPPPTTPASVAVATTKTAAVRIYEDERQGEGSSTLTST
jgi:hypothetical protein